MAYCTKADLEQAFGASLISSWSDGSAEKVQHAIDNADGVIDGYLISGGYRIPINPVPKNLNVYAVDLAAYNLLTAKGVHDSPGDKAIIDRAKDARSFFSKVASGHFRIPVPTEDGPDEARPSGSIIKVSAPERIDLSGYR